MRDRAHLSIHSARGALFENFVISELLKRRYNQGLPSNLYFRRNNTGDEVDLVIEQGEQLIPVEIKSSQTFNTDFLAGPAQMDPPCRDRRFAAIADAEVPANKVSRKQNIDTFSKLRWATPDNERNLIPIAFDPGVVAGDSGVTPKHMTSTMDATTEFWRDQALPYVESRRACYSRACYKPHSHPTFSIGAVDQGSSHFTGAAGGPALIQAGSVVFVPSTCVHSCNPLPNTAWSYQMLHLDAAWLKALRQESSAGERKDVMLTRDASVYAGFCRLNAFLFSAASVHEKEAALIEFIGDCDSDDLETIAAPEQAILARRRLQPVLERLQDEGVAMGSLTELAKMAGMSRYQLIRAFRASTGMTPHVYQLNLRINEARVWLRSGEEMADIAYRLGFADQSHFQRVFKAYAGVTPGRYRS